MKLTKDPLLKDIPVFGIMFSLGLLWWLLKSDATFWFSLQWIFLIFYLVSNAIAERYEHVKLIKVASSIIFLVIIFASVVFFIDLFIKKPSIETKYIVFGTLPPLWLVFLLILKVVLKRTQSETIRTVIVFLPLVLFIISLLLIFTYQLIESWKQI